MARRVNMILSPLGIRVVPSQHPGNDPRDFLPLSETLSAARRAGLSVGDYIDRKYNVEGATQHTIDQMRQLGVLSGATKDVLEIGPGSGRYLEKVMRECSPTRYEIYETSDPWAGYLETRYDVIKQITTGRSLSPTPDNSIDLVHAHKVFVVTPFVVTCQYWLEMLRVARSGAHIVFDIVTESCMDPPTLQRWFEEELNVGNYPAIVPREYAIDFFADRTASLVGSFFIPMRPGRTETFVFRKG